MRGSRAGSDEAAAAGAFWPDWFVASSARSPRRQSSLQGIERDVAEEVTLAAYGKSVCRVDKRGKYRECGWVGPKTAGGVGVPL